MGTGLPGWTTRFDNPVDFAGLSDREQPATTSKQSQPARIHDIGTAAADSLKCRWPGEAFPATMGPVVTDPEDRPWFTEREADYYATFLGASSAESQKNFRILMVFDDTNPLPDRMPDAVVANDHLGMDLPPLIAGARAFAIKKKAVDDYPDRYQILTDTLKKVYDDPEYKVAVEKTKAPWEFIKYGSPEDCAKYVKDITAIGEQFKDLLTGKS